jgi:hypothetical protein
LDYAFDDNGTDIELHSMELEELAEAPLEMEPWALEDDPRDPTPAWVDAYEF